MSGKLNDMDLIWTEESKNELLRTPIATISETLSTASDGQKHKYINRTINTSVIFNLYT